MLSTTDLLYFISTQRRDLWCTQHHPVPEKQCTVCVQRLEVIVKCRKTATRLSAICMRLFPTPVCPRKSVAQKLESIVADSKNRGQVICSLHVSLLSAQICPRKTATRHAHRGLGLMWLTAKSCYKVICPLCTPFSLLLSTLPTVLALAFFLSMTLLHEKGPLLFIALWFSSPTVHGSKPCICHVLFLQLCRLFS